MLLSLDQSISVQLYALNFLPVFAGYCRFLPVFSTVLAKILFAMAKPNPVSYGLSIVTIALSLTV